MTTKALEAQRARQRQSQPASQQPQSQDKLVVPADWTFQNRNVADNFDIHVREQLPWYELATGIVAHLGRHFLPEDGLMYDLGASTGNITKALESEITKRKVTAISLDNSAPMGDVFRGVGQFEIADIRTYEFQPYDFCACFLVLMFLQPVQQRAVFQRLAENLRPGGALVIFDRTAIFNGYLGQVVNRLTLAGKVATGVPAESIVKKELSLAGAQRPISPEYLGFAEEGVAEIFRFGDFAGWVLTR